MPPKVEIKQFSGALNLDDPIHVLGKGFHLDARGIEFEGSVPNRRVSVVNGNAVVTNALLPLTGTNKTICNLYDAKNKRIFFLNYNSTGKHGIYVYNTIPGTFQRLIEVGINTIGNPLGFTAESHSNIDILYGDSTQGDMLYFIDSNGVPSKININRAIAGGYGNIQRSFLDVAKEPASIPPYVVYESDPTVTVNGLRKKLFRAKVRWAFDDQDKSVTSSQSIMALPAFAFDQSIDSDPTKNCRLAITYQTGAANVKKVEILISNSLGNVMSDFYLVASLDKDALNIPDNDIATYLFYNDKGYDNIDIDESGQLFDYVPQGALSQAILNGNVPSYGSPTEGYPNISNFSFGNDTSFIESLQVPYYYGNTFSNLIATQNGMSGFDAGTIHIIVRGVIFTPPTTADTYFVYMEDGTNVSYAISTSDDSAAIIEGLRVDALSKGYTIISAGNNDLYITKVDAVLSRALIDSNYIAPFLMNTSLAAYPWLSRHGFGQVYFDGKGRTNGVVFTDGFSVSSVAYSESASPNNKPLFRAYVYHTPPLWAESFQWVRTNDLTKSKNQQWITDRTFKDTTTLSGQIRYAYLSIESLNEFVEKNPGSPLGYGFTPGDRIRFFKRYNADGSTANLYGDSKNFEVVASLVNPTINGEVKSGQFVKLILPPTDGNFDFGVTGFANYFIELYTPAQSVANGLNVYYEFGERYAIAYAGSGNRFHQGSIQNQIPNTDTPAVYDFMNGDYYVRLRAVQAGNVYTYNIVGGQMTAGRFLFGLNFVDSTYTDPNITAQSVPFSNISGNTPSGGINPGSDTRWFLRSTPAANTFRIQIPVIINFTTNVPGDTWRIFTLNRFNERNYLQTFDASSAGTYEFNIDFSQTIEDDRLFLIAEGGERPLSVFSGQMTSSIDHVISQRMIDKNFSDYFPSAVNSNGRAWLFDADANQVTYPPMYRYGLEFQEETNINLSNRFYPRNFDNANRAHGSIMKMAQMGNELILFQERKIGHTGIFQRAITNASTTNQLITTDTIITQNNVQYYGGEVGVGNQPTGVVKSGYVFYGVDPIKNIIWRLSRDGVTDLSELYKVKSWASANITKYLSPGNYPFGGVQKILGTFNVRPDNIGEYLLLAQGATIAGETFAFEENNNAFTGKYDVDCDCIVCAENVMFYFKNGVLWKQTSSVGFNNNFFGVQYTASILISFNDQMAVKKNYMAIAYQSESVWNAGTNADVETDTINSQTFLRQQSKIMVQDFDSLENPNRYASFNRDMNSMSSASVALWEGDYLTGHYILVRLRHQSNGSNYLFAPYVTYSIAPRNF